MFSLLNFGEFMDAQILDALRKARTVAVVGLSNKLHRPSHRVARYLQEAGYRIIPVNPYCKEVLNEKCYPDLKSIPEDISIDIVNIFRRAPFTKEVVKEVIERSQKTGEKPIIWTQIGASSEEAQRLAEEAGFTYVPNRCLMIEHAHYIGSPD